MPLSYPCQLYPGHLQSEISLALLALTKFNRANGTLTYGGSLTLVHRSLNLSHMGGVRTLVVMYYPGKLH